MKKLGLLITLSAVILVSFQSQGQLKFAVAGGVNISKFLFHNGNYWDYTKGDSKFLVAPKIGALLDIKLPSVMGIQTGIFLSGKGDNAGRTMLTQTYKDKYMPYYIEIPACFFVQKLGFRLFAGGYYAQGIGGKLKYDYPALMGGSGKEKIVFKNNVSIADQGKDVVYMIPFDYGFTGGVSVKFLQLLITGGYSAGFVNLTPKMEGLSVSDRKDARFYNRNFYVTLGYYLFKI